MDPTQPANDETVTNPITPEPTKDNVQARFDELTATIHEQRRQMEAQNIATQELIASLAASNARANVPTPTTPSLPEGADPQLVNFLTQQFSQAMSQQMNEVKKEFTQLLGGVRQSQQMTELQQATQGIDPKVAELANHLYSDWQKKGLPGWTPKDAVVYARGQVALNEEQTRRKQQPNGNGSDTITQGHAGLPSTTTTSKLQPVKSDEELRKMTLAQQEAYWSARVGDSEIVY